LILVRISMLTYMKCIQDFNLVTIIVNHNHFRPQMNLNLRPLLLWLIFQNESVKTGPIDVRISIGLKITSHENTQAYCLLLYNIIV